MRKRQINFRISNELEQRLNKHKKATKETTTFICATALKEYLDRYQNEYPEYEILGK